MLLLLTANMAVVASRVNRQYKMSDKDFLLSNYYFLN